MYRYLHEKGIMLFDNVPDQNSGGLMGNALDRGRGYFDPSYRDHFNSHCGMEVVLANGEIMRTGMGALPGSKLWQQYKYGLGPCVDGMFSQGNMGVVTKMGFWMLPMVEAFLTGTAYVPRHDDLHRLVEIQNYLLHTGVSNGFASLASPLMRGGFGMSQMPGEQAPKRDPELAALLEKLDARALSPELEKYGLRKGIPYWSATLAFYGPARVIKAKWEYSKEKFSAIPGATFQDGDLIRFPLTPQVIEKLPGRLAPAALGVPDLSTFGQSIRGRNRIPPIGHLHFNAVTPRTAQEIFEVNRAFGEFGVETGLQPFSPSSFKLPMDYCGDRVFFFIFGFQIMADIETNKRTRAGYRAAAKVGAENGWSEYRMHPVFFNDVMADLSYNNHSLMRLWETIKDAVDPNGILSPGRYGVWPKHLRHMKEAKGS